MFFLQKGLAGELYINKIKKIEFWLVSVLWGGESNEFRECKEPKDKCR